MTDITTSLEAIAGYMDFSCLSFVDKKEEEEVHPYDHLAEQDTWNSFADFCIWCCYVIVIHESCVLDTCNMPGHKVSDSGSPFLPILME